MKIYNTIFTPPEPLCLPKLPTAEPEFVNVYLSKPEPRNRNDSASLCSLAGRYVKFEMILMLFLEAWGKMIHEKNLSKNLVTLSL
jgi:hypothetical protein